MKCDQPGHRGCREVQKILYVPDGGKLISGCVQCMDDRLHQMYSTQKRMRTMPNGKQFWISPAHVHDIRQRRVSPDLSHTWRDKKGIGSAMKY